MVYYIGIERSAIRFVSLSTLTLFPKADEHLVSIRLDLQLEDVESAMESELLDTGFYRRLVRSLL